MKVLGRFGQQRKIITGATLGVWLFALAVGMAHACGWDEPDLAPTHAVAVLPGDNPSDDGAPIGCQQFCKTDVPVVTKLPAVGDQPGEQPPIVAVNGVHAVAAPAVTLRLIQAAHPPADVPPFLRFTHLRL